MTSSVISPFDGVTVAISRDESTRPHDSPIVESTAILDQLQLFPLPVPPNVPSRPVTVEEKDRIDLLADLQFFLATAPTRWNQADAMQGSTNLSKFQLPNGEFVSCILWNGLYHITGTDIVRALAFRFEAFGRPVKATKKWEEGVFSDLRNLKPGTDASLEEPKSPLLDFLFRNGCIRTQKKQKVFYWFSVPHDRLFLDALERDLKREKNGKTPTTEIVGEPARSFKYDPRRSLYEQFAGQNPGMNINLMTTPSEYPRVLSVHPGPAFDQPLGNSTYYASNTQAMRQAASMADPVAVAPYVPPTVATPAVTFQRTLFQGSPAYKRRRARSRQTESPVVDDASQRRASPAEVSQTSEARDATLSPRASHVNLRQVSGSDRGASPKRSRRDRQPSSAASDKPGESERLYVCALEQCRRPFKRLEHLKRHVRTHTMEKPYGCTKCTRSFSRQDNLVQHLRTHGPGEDVAYLGLGIGTPPPREGVDYFVSTGEILNAYRWATASPAGDGRDASLPFRSLGGMPPPSLPQSARHATVPPEWTVALPDDQPATAPIASDTMDLHGRRYRSVTPSAYSYPTATILPPPPSGWGSAPSAPSSFASAYHYSHWRPPSGIPYGIDPAATDHSPMLGYDQSSYDIHSASTTDNYGSTTGPASASGSV